MSVAPGGGHPIHVAIRDLSVHYPLGRPLFGKPPMVRAVDGVSLDIPRAAFFGLAGESGSGKTTLGRAILRAAPVTARHVTYRDAGVEYDVVSLGKVALRDFRRRAQLIFQAPYAALSPRMTVRDIIAEPLEVMKLTASREETDPRVREMAASCRLNLEHLRRFPHAFCRFHTRCPFAQNRCRVEVPAWREVAPGHHAACHFSDELKPLLYARAPGAAPG